MIKKLKIIDSISICHNKKNIIHQNMSKNSKDSISKIVSNTKEFMNELEANNAVDLTQECENIDKLISSLEEKVNKKIKTKGISNDEQFTELRNIYLQIATCMIRFDSVAGKLIHALNGVFKAQKGCDVEEMEEEVSDDEQVAKIGKPRKEEKQEQPKPQSKSKSSKKQEVEETHEEHENENENNKDDKEDVEQEKEEPVEKSSKKKKTKKEEPSEPSEPVETSTKTSKSSKSKDEEKKESKKEVKTDEKKSDKKKK